VGGRRTTAIWMSLAAALAVPVGASAATTGGTAPPSSRTSPATTGGAQYTPPAPTPDPSAPTGVARIENGVAYAPAGAPLAVVRAIRAGNKIRTKPYRYGGGHASFKDTAYDCSGTVSFALHGAKLLKSPLDSGSLMKWGVAGPGSWITVYANPGHTYVVVAGLRLDTSGTGGRGPRWQLVQRDNIGFVARHPAGL
jgi:hypothetical protein